MMFKFEVGQIVTTHTHMQTVGLDGGHVPLILIAERSEQTCPGGTQRHYQGRINWLVKGQDSWLDKASATVGGEYYSFNEVELAAVDLAVVREKFRLKTRDEAAAERATK